MNAAGFTLFFGYSYFTGNKTKAGLFATTILGVFIFFGAFQDFLSSIKVTATLSSLPFLLPVTLFFLFLFFVWLQFRKAVPQLLLNYINLILFIFILFDLVQSIKTAVSESTDNINRPSVLNICDSCTKPSVYLVVLDEYAGDYTLKNFFSFDNSFFYNSLSQKGFHIADSSVSNYGMTVLSMASMLNMDYLNSNEIVAENKHYTYRKAIEQIKTNSVTSFFSREGYQIINYSFFDLQESPAMIKNDLWGGNIRLYTNQTLYGRIKKSLPLYLASKNISNYFIQQVENEYLDQMNAALSESVEREKLQDTNSAKPSFTYIHLNIPHEPFLMDSSGNRISEKSRRQYTAEQKQAAYVQYLVYCNKRILKWVDEIQAASKRKAVILIMSDHGTRPLLPKDQLHKRMDNLNAIYFPGADYSKWYKGISNVNQFRLVFNQLFKQTFSLKPDREALKQLNSVNK
ncbi:MAG: sulfatase-like hydrolase/transferase [Lacibacter sp.]